LPKKNDFRPNSSQKSIVRGGIDRKRIILFTISILLLLGTLTAFSTSSSRREPDNRLKIPKGSSNYIGSDYSTVIAELQAAGFSNVQTAVLDDLIMGWLTKDGEVESVKVGGKTTFRAGSRYTPNVPIVVTYHTYPAKTTDRAKETAPQLNSLSVTASNTPNLTAPDIHAVSVNFPVKYALRAAVVAFTNYYATDVLTSDGNDYDISKFHSYADVAGFFMNVESEGTWTAKSKNTWHVDHLKLKIYEVGSVVDASLNVSYDGSRYKVSNLTGKGPSYPDISNLENERYFALCSSVPPALIQDDRNAAKVVARDHSGELPKRDARKAFEKYGQHKSYGFKCHWGSGLRYEEQRVDGSWFFKVEVIIQNQYGAKRKAIAEGVVKNNTTRSVEQFHVH
jgi:hypothetical protein